MAAPIDSVPMARGADRPLWPLKDGKTQTSFKSSASFGAPDPIDMRGLGPQRMKNTGRRTRAAGPGAPDPLQKFPRG